MTLFGALPMYRWVARMSSRGDGSISMLEHLLPWWEGKLFVFGLIGFVSTGFVVTITLPAADAAAHIVENRAAHALLGHEVLVTLVLVVLLGAVFLRGFSEAINLAVGLVAVYIALNLLVIGTGLAEIAHHPHLLGNRRHSLVQAHPNPALTIVAAILVFPKLALGLSGFETGDLVMPLIRGDPTNTARHPHGRIRNGPDRPPQHRAALRAPLWNGPRLGTGDEAACDLSDPHLHPRHPHIPGQRQRPGGRLCDRRACYHDLRQYRGHAVRST